MLVSLNSFFNHHCCYKLTHIKLIVESYYQQIMYVFTTFGNEEKSKLLLEFMLNCPTFNQILKENINEQLNKKQRSIHIDERHFLALVGISLANLFVLSLLGYSSQEIEKTYIDYDPECEDMSKGFIQYWLGECPILKPKLCKSAFQKLIVDKFIELKENESFNLEHHFGNIIKMCYSYNRLQNLDHDEDIPDCDGWI